MYCNRRWLLLIYFCEAATKGRDVIATSSIVEWGSAICLTYYGSRHIWLNGWTILKHTFKNVLMRRDNANKLFSNTQYNYLTANCFTSNATHRPFPSFPFFILPALAIAYSVNARKDFCSWCVDEAMKCLLCVNYFWFLLLKNAIPKNP